MSNGTGRIVQALAGRDRGNFLFVVGQTQDGQLLLADGKRRKAVSYTHLTLPTTVTV